MTVRDKVLKPLEKARAKIDKIGFRRYAVALNSRTWSGTEVSEGTPTDAPLVAFAPAPRVRLVSLREVAASGGTYRDGDFRIDRVTPAYANRAGFVVANGSGSVATQMLIPPSGVTHGRFPCVVQIAADGGPGTGAQFVLSTDGGATFGPPVAMGATYDVPNLGTRLAFAGGFLTGETYAFNLACGGYTPQQLRPSTTARNQEFVYVLTGDEGAFECTLVRADADRALGYSLVVRRSRATP